MSVMVLYFTLFTNWPVIMTLFAYLNQTQSSAKGQGKSLFHTVCSELQDLLQTSEEGPTDHWPLHLK